MSGNVESLTMRKCTRCLKKYPVDDWGTKSNGDYYLYCNACRVENRDDYRRKALVPEFRERCKEQHRENYAAAKEERTKCLEKVNDDSPVNEESDDDEIFRCRTANSGMRTNARGLVDPAHPWVCRSLKNEVVCSGCGKTFRSTTNVNVHVKNNRCKGAKSEV